MQPARIHVFGAPGAGVTTLGRELALRLGCPHFDTDDFVWFTDDPLPYRRKRNLEHRRQVLSQALDEAGEQWVLTGSLCGWGDVFIPRFNLAVYCWLPADVRLNRIRQREMLRYGAERLTLGGDLHGVFEKFLQWASDYDQPGDQWRGRDMERAWLAALPCPILLFEAPVDVNRLLDDPSFMGK